MTTNTDSIITSDEISKYTKSLCLNKYTKRNIASVFKDGKFNKKRFTDIMLKADFKYFNTKITVAVVLLMQSDRETYNDEFMKTMLNEIQPSDLVFTKKAVDVARYYGIYNYYRSINDDALKLPDAMYEKFCECFTDYVPNMDVIEAVEDEDLKTMLGHICNTDMYNYSYLIYDIEKTKSITKYIYKNFDLSFNDSADALLVVEEEETDDADIEVG